MLSQRHNRCCSLYQLWPVAAPFRSLLELSVSNQHGSNSWSSLTEATTPAVPLLPKPCHKPNTSSDRSCLLGWWSCWWGRCFRSVSWTTEMSKWKWEYWSYSISWCQTEIEVRENQVYFIRRNSTLFFCTEKCGSTHLAPYLYTIKYSFSSHWDTKVLFCFCKLNLKDWGIVGVEEL